jgi:hypothetical protein
VKNDRYVRNDKFPNSLNSVPNNSEKHPQWFVPDGVAKTRRPQWWSWGLGVVARLAKMKFMLLRNNKLILSSTEFETPSS